MLGSAWNRWNWLEDGLIPLGAVLMQAAWAFPLFALFLRVDVVNSQADVASTNPGFTFWLCCAILSGGVLAGKMARDGESRQNPVSVVIVVVGGLAAIWIALLLTVPAGPQSLGSWFSGILDHVRYGRTSEAVPAPFSVGLCATLLWWRGVRIAAADHSETVGSFVAGVVAFLGLLFLAILLPDSVSQNPARAVQGLGSVIGPMAFLVGLVAALAGAVASRFLGERAMVFSQLSVTMGLLCLALILPVGPSADALSRWALLFLSSGLATLALDAVLHALLKQAERTGILLRIDRYWAATALGTVIVVMVLGLIVGQVVAPGTLAKAFGWLRPGWAALLRVLMLILLAVAYLFFGLFEPLLARIGARSSQGAPRPFGSPLNPEDLELLARDPVQFPPILGQFLRAMLILGLVALIAWVFVIALKKRKRGARIQDDIAETRETILSTDLIRSQLRGLLNGLRRPKPPPVFVDPGRPTDPRRAIRELYQQVLARGIALDIPRARGQTPDAYQAALHYVYTGTEEQRALDTLTSAYVAARYGLAPPTQHQVHAAQEAFALLDAAQRNRQPAVPLQ